MVSFKFILRQISVHWEVQSGQKHDSSRISNKTQETEAQPGFVICQTDEERLKVVFTYVFYRFAHHYQTMVKDAIVCYMEMKTNGKKGLAIIFTV